MEMMKTKLEKKCLERKVVEETTEVAHEESADK